MLDVLRSTTQTSSVTDTDQVLRWAEQKCPCPFLKDSINIFEQVKITKITLTADGASPTVGVDSQVLEFGTAGLPINPGELLTPAPTLVLMLILACPGSHLWDCPSRHSRPRD